jgi:hypothetical protein
MALKKLFFVSLILSASVLPLSLHGQVPMPVQAPQAITEEEARRFLDEYVARYARMDIDAFMNLFSREATENRMLPYADIYEIYRKNFLNSSSLSYNLKVYFVQPYARSAFVSGCYEVVQSLKPKGQQHVFRGNIQWNLVREEGSLKVMEINYGRDRER